MDRLEAIPEEMKACQWKRQIAIFFRCTNWTVFWQTVCKDILKMLRDKINRMNKQCSKREGEGGWMDRLMDDKLC